MELGGDVTRDHELCDVGDSRHKNILRLGKNKQEAVAKSDDEQELEPLGFEVMDSEGDGEDGDDPFKLVERKRAATSVTDSGRDSRKVVKRSSTEPVFNETQEKKRQRKKKKKKNDLLTVLLPDNMDTIPLDNEFSIGQESTPMTSMVLNGDSNEEGTTLNTEDLKNLLKGEERATHTGEPADVDKTSESSQDIVLEKVEVYDTTGDKGWYEKDIGALQRKVNDQLDESTSNQAREDVIMKDNSGEKEGPSMEEQVVEREPKDESNRTAVSALQKELPTSAVRSTRRKSTLADLCAKKNSVPYRVGLSRRANVNHLHSYLSKK